MAARAAVRDQFDHPVKRVIKAARHIGRAMQIVRAAGNLGRGDRQTFAVLRLTTRDGHFGADDIVQRPVLRCPFCHGAKIGRAGCHFLIAQSLAIAGHGRVKVDFREPRSDICRGQPARFGHRLRGRFRPPRVWPQMVAAKDQARLVHAFCARCAEDEFLEIGGRHSSLPTELIDLIAGQSGLAQCRRGRCAGSRQVFRDAPCTTTAGPPPRLRDCALSVRYGSSLACKHRVDFCKALIAFHRAKPCDRQRPRSVGAGKCLRPRQKPRTHRTRMRRARPDR